MKLSALIDAVNPLQVSGSGTGKKDPVVTGVCYRSDRAAPGSVFVAVKGAKTDGLAFVEDAVSRGAVAVVAEKPVDADATIILVPDARKAMATMADAFYGAPSAKLFLTGITGTNGKTTTAFILEHILKENGFKTGVIGTIDCHFGDTIIPGALTTPESPDLQERLARMADAGVTHAIMEVSSHGVVQDRVFACRFDMGIFTNLSQDHLDFHGNMDAYREAKTGFFTGYMNRGATAVINCDSDEGRKLAAGLKAGLKQGNVLSVGTDKACDVWAQNISCTHAGISGRMVLPSGDFDFHSPLVGRFNLENILCAVGAGFSMGVDPETMRKAVATFAAVPGRLEKVAGYSSRSVFVDYSHTPEALENVLATLQSIVPGRVICVFGCGGDRDRGKRPQMGKIAATLADIVIVTSDNPRTEPPEKIIADILTGVRQTEIAEISAKQLGSGVEKGVYAVVQDRSDAIDLGIRISRSGDGVLIAGKGHETYQIIGQKTIDFDDRVQAKKALSKYGIE